jgi:predicted CXXCH cytochrome family protein
MLVLSAQQNELCLTCHVPLTPALFSDQTRSKHGRLPALDIEQRGVAATFKADGGAREHLACITCHAMHRAPTADNLLAFDLAQRDACADCHASQRSIVGSTHDLRTNHPQERNIVGVPAEAAGACGGCHTAHRYAREARVTAPDPTGRCTTCHSPGQVAAAAQLGPVNHPQAACRECHNPHETRHPHYLAAAPVDSCRQCHAGYLDLMGGPHDLRVTAAAWPEASREAADPCL